MERYSVFEREPGDWWDGVRHLPLAGQRQRHEARCRAGLHRVTSTRIIRISRARPSRSPTTKSSSTRYWIHDRLFTSSDRPNRLRAGEWQWAFDAVLERTRYEPDVQDALALITRLVDAAPADRLGPSARAPSKICSTAAGPRRSTLSMPRPAATRGSPGRWRRRSRPTTSPPAIVNAWTATASTFRGASASLWRRVSAPNVVVGSARGMPCTRQPGMRRWSLLLVAVFVVALGACKVDTTVTVKVDGDGSGEVVARVALDADAVRAVEAGGVKLENAIRLQDLAKAGWKSSGWVQHGKGGARC